MKKIISLLLIFSLVAFCCSCGEGDPSAETTVSTPSATPSESTPSESPSEAPEETPDEIPAETPFVTPEDVPAQTTPEDTDKNGNFEIGEESDDRIWGDFNPPM